MKNIYKLLIALVVLIGSSELVNAQTSTYSSPWPGSTHTYSFGANAALDQTDWWVSLDPTGANPITVADAAFTIVDEDGNVTIGANGIMTGTEVNTIRINWGAASSGTYYIFLNVTDDVSNCSNLKGFKVIVSSTFNAIAENVTGGADITNGTITPGNVTVDGCSDDSSNPIANEGVYTLGSSELAFKVTRDGSLNNWQLGYSITGATVTSVLVKDEANADVGTAIASATGTSSPIAGANDYVIVYVTVDNTVGAQAVVFNLVPANTKDVVADVADDGTHGDDIASYTIKLMPAIGTMSGGN